MKNKNNKKEGAFLRFLYKTVVGRMFLRVMYSRAFSKLAGLFFDSRLSVFLIKPFIKKHAIDTENYYCENLKSFNDFFTRKIKDGKRNICADKNALISPCDGLLCAYKIDKNTVFPVKQSLFSTDGLLGGDAAAQRFENGICLVFRLCVDNYHRYCYFDSGKKGENIFIKGKLHTVRPIALKSVPVFTENCREYTIMETENFGTAIQLEVGAMLVGKIKNYHGAANITRGEEKGMFLYGGSSIIILLEKDAAQIDEKIFSNTENGIETPVKMGEKIGHKRGR